MRGRWLWAAVLIFAAVPASAAPHGHLQVKAEPGVEVKIGSLVATTEDTDGATFRRLAPGAHRLEAHREGYMSQHAVLWIRPGEVTLYRLVPWLFAVQGKGSAAIVIQTLPVETTIAARTLGYGKFAKGSAPAVLPKIEAGLHKITLCTAYKCIDYRAEVQAGAVLNLFVDFDSGLVQDLSEEYGAHVKRLTEDCLVRLNADACKQACVRMKRIARPSPTCATAKPMPVNVARDFP